MQISEEYLKELVLRILRELQNEAENQKPKQKTLYLVCLPSKNEACESFLRDMEAQNYYQICAVIPNCWKNQEQEQRLKLFHSCKQIRYYSDGIPEDLEEAVSIFPAITKDLLAKAALCISDTFETAWMERGIEAGARTVFLRSGLAKFSGKEKTAYTNKIMEYYRQVLEYGVEICNTEELLEEIVR